MNDQNFNTINPSENTEDAHTTNRESGAGTTATDSTAAAGDTYTAPESSGADTSSAAETVTRQDGGYRYTDASKKAYSTYQFSENNTADQANTQEKGQPNWNSASYNKYSTPKQSNDTLKNLGLFAAKAAIASVIGSVIFVGTFAIAQHTGLITFGTGTATTNEASGSYNYGELPDFDEFFGSQDGNSAGEQGDGSTEDGTADQTTDGPKLGVMVESVAEDQIETGSPAGVLIQSIVSGSDAEAAGLQVGDIITAFDGTSTSSASTLSSLVQSCEAGDTVTITYKRAENGTYTTYTTQVTFSETEDAQ